MNQGTPIWPSGLDVSNGLKLAVSAVSTAGSMTRDGPCAGTVVDVVDVVVPTAGCLVVDGGGAPIAVPEQVLATSAKATRAAPVTLGSSGARTVSVLAAQAPQKWAGGTRSLHARPVEWAVPSPATCAAGPRSGRSGPRRRPTRAAGKVAAPSSKRG